MARKVKITQEIGNILEPLTNISNREKIELPISLISKLKE
jgi:hypothetical protein